MQIEQRIASKRREWQGQLTEIRKQPLQYCEGFPEIAQRWNDWWAYEADRPLIVAKAAKTDDIRWDKAFDLLNSPGEWLEVRRKQVENMHCAGEAMPGVRVDIGPVATAVFLGAPLHFAYEENTSWQDPIIESWEDVPDLRADFENFWLRKTLALLDKLAEDASGKYLVCLPDLTGAIDALANLRSAQKLCFDLYDHRQQVLAAASRIVNAWEAIFRVMYDTVLQHETGITQWVACWADSPFTVPTCDFNALIGTDDFTEVCMPSLKDQARRAGHCVLHLDGPDAARHAETLAEDPDITAVQFTPGAGTPSALEKLPLFQMFQRHQVPLFIETPLHEVKPLLHELDPRGVAVRPGVRSPQEADALVQWRDDTFA